MNNRFYYSTIHPLFQTIYDCVEQYPSSIKFLYNPICYTNPWKKSAIDFYLFFLIFSLGIHPPEESILYLPAAESSKNFWLKLLLKHHLKIQVHWPSFLWPGEVTWLFQELLQISKAQCPSIKNDADGSPVHIDFCSTYSYVSVLLPTDSTNMRIDLRGSSWNLSGSGYSPPTPSVVHGYTARSAVQLFHIRIPL